MYFHLTQATKRRLILELKEAFAEHPVYSKIVPWIQNKYSFQERPEFGIVLKGVSANKLALAANNFIGTVESHVMLSYIGAPTFPIEWVREDSHCLKVHNGIMPTPPGIYYIEILSAPEDAQSEGEYIIDPLITVSDEEVMRFTSGVETEGQLQHIPIEKTLRLYENQGRYLLKEGIDYTIEWETGAIKFVSSANPGAVVTADYRYEVPSIGPIKFQWNKADFSTLPGVVLAFGKRGKKGDKVAVVVYEDRVSTADAYGGKFEQTLDFDVIAADPIQAGEIADLMWMYLYGYRRPGLSTDGIEVTDVSLGGEAEEVKDETSEDFTYMVSVSVQLQSDWEFHLPLPLAITKVTQIAIPEILGSRSLVMATNPVLIHRNNDFERIR